MPSFRDRFREYDWVDLEPSQGLSDAPAIVHRADGCRAKRNLVHPHELPEDAELCGKCFAQPEKEQQRPDEPRTDGGVQPFQGGVTAGTAVLRGHVAVTPDGRLDLSPGAGVVGSLALLMLGAFAAACGGE